jgi:membrane associated rhomboid family serine protease
MFMHAGLVHLGGNMLFLWIFGNNVEDAMGPIRFLVFYLLSGVAATAVQTYVTLETAPGGAAIPNLGASGAVSGVLGAYLVLLPHARVLTLIVVFLREIPAFVFLGLYFVFQAWQANFQLREAPTDGGVAVFAHIGGFLFGMAAVWVFKTRRPLQPRYR